MHSIKRDRALEYCKKAFVDKTARAEIINHLVTKFKYTKGSAENLYRDATSYYNFKTLRKRLEGIEAREFDKWKKDHSPQREKIQIKEYWEK